MTFEFGKLHFSRILLSTHRASDETILETREKERKIGMIMTLCYILAGHRKSATETLIHEMAYFFPANFHGDMNTFLSSSKNTSLNVNVGTFYFDGSILRNSGRDENFGGNNDAIEIVGRARGNQPLFNVFNARM